MLELTLLAAISIAGVELLRAAMAHGVGQPDSKQKTYLSFTEKPSTQSQQKHGLARGYLMKTLLGNPTVFNVKNAVEGLHIEQIHLLQVFQGEWDAAQLLPHQRGQVQVQRLLCANGNPH